MKTNTLETIQKLAKAGKILSKIVFICCLIGVIGCAVGGLAMAFIPKELTFGNVHVIGIGGLIEKNSGVAMGNIYAAVLCGAVAAGAECMLAYFAGRYFENELEAGTPFTFEGAAELKKLGIRTIVIPIAAIVAAEIVRAVLAHYMPGVRELPYDNGVSVGLGIMFLVGSLLCRYGAEQQAQKES